jgi:hypothetical protein
LGRFLSSDTIIPDLGNPQSINKYSYVYNDPLRHTDPTGHAPAEDRNICPQCKKALEFLCPDCFNANGTAKTDPLSQLNLALAESSFIPISTIEAPAIRGLEAAPSLAEKAFQAISDRLGPVVDDLVGKLGGNSGNIVFRALRAGEQETIDAGLGIVRSEGQTTLTQHVLGANRSTSPWVSTSRSLDVATYWATNRGTESVAGPIIAIDLSKVSYPVVDVSTRELAATTLKHPRAISYAVRGMEVLIQGGVNPEAIFQIWRK